MATDARLAALKDTASHTTQENKLVEKINLNPLARLIDEKYALKD
jgi:hypothetical protein